MRQTICSTSPSITCLASVFLAFGVTGQTQADSLASRVAPTPVSDATTSVAVIPRPEIEKTNERPECLHRGPELVRVRSSWVNGDGVLIVPEGNEISYNLAAGIKIMGDVSEPALAALLAADQEGFILNQSADFTNPADRAAAGFYIPNANN